MIRLPIARRSLPYIVLSFLPAMIAFVFSGLAGCILLVPALFVLNFFRDPERTPPSVADGTLLAPADGKVISIEDSPHEDWKGYQRISIFMNIFNVHVNRVPADAKLKMLQHFPGRFLPADNPLAPVENERMEITLITKHAPVLVTLVAGLIARRIYCWARPDDQLLQGQRFSLIKFGSRVDLHVPSNGKFLVSPGTCVKAGLTPVYEFAQESGQEE